MAGWVLLGDAAIGNSALVYAFNMLTRWTVSSSSQSRLGEGKSMLLGPCITSSPGLIWPLCWWASCGVDGVRSWQPSQIWLCNLCDYWVLSEVDTLCWAISWLTTYALVKRSIHIPLSEFLSSSLQPWYSQVPGHPAKAFCHFPV